MSKPLVEYTFEELVQGACRDIHNGLLESGGKGLKGAVWAAMATVVNWRQELDKKAALEDKQAKEAKEALDKANASGNPL